MFSRLAKVSLDSEMVLVWEYVHTYVHKVRTVVFSEQLELLRRLPISSHKKRWFLNG